MINKIKLTNFEAHKDSVLDFCPGVNVVIGKTDSGKSSIRRALSVVAENKPSGIKYIRKGQKNCSVELHVDGQIIKRFRSKSENQYFLGDNEYNAVGVDVPEDVKNLINFSDLNLHRQFDSHFLLSKSPGEVSRYINKVAGLDIVDDAMSGAESKVRKAKANLSQSEYNIEEMKNKIKEFDWLDKAEQSFEKIKELQKNHTKIKQEYDNISGIVSELKELDSKEIIDAKKAQKEFDSIQASEKEYIDLVEDEGNLLNFISDWQDLEEKTIEFDVKKAQREFDSIANDLSVVEGLEQNYVQIGSIVDSLIKSESKLSLLNQEVVLVEKELEEIMPEKCPLCGK